MPTTPDESWLKLGVAADQTGRCGADNRDFMCLLALLLQQALPDETQLEREGGLFSKRSLHRIVQTLGAERYGLEDPGHGPLIAT